MDSSVDRLEQITKQCSKFHIEFERVSAIRGDSLSAEQKSKIYDSSANQKKYSKLLNDGEIGCYLSHVACWNKIITDELDYALILEDDAILSNDLTAFIGHISHLSPNWDYIKLSHGRKTKHILEQLILADNLSINSCLKLPSTTTGQFVSLVGAQKLVDSAYPISRPIDMDIQYWFEKKLRCFVVRPFPVKDACLGSEINKMSNRLDIKSNRIKAIWLKIKFEYCLFLNRNKRGKVSEL